MIADYVRNDFEDAGEALEWLLWMNRRLGIWCACACVREVLGITPPGSKARLAIQIAEDWVRNPRKGNVTKRKIELVSQETREEWDKAPNPECYTVAAAHRIITSISGIMVDSWIKDVAYAVSIAQGFNRRAFVEELRRLVDVIADAIMTFPRIANARMNPTKYQKATTSFLRKLPPEMNQRDKVALMKYVREMDLEYDEIETFPNRMIYVIPWLARLLSGNDRIMTDLLSPKAEKVCQSLGWKDRDGYDIAGYPSEAAVGLSLSVNGSPKAQQWLKSHYPSLVEAIGG